mmetsp:Transcript_13058/g.20937  ORF Transcript_13058/g.20937 Transcript_13058/m.20937 type:complete len:178 (-) Transcript_13058:230-763(-)
MALKYHPDVNNASDAHEHFSRIKFAYETLRNPQKRTEYIEQGKAKFQSVTPRVKNPKRNFDQEDNYGMNDFMLDLARDQMKKNRTTQSLWQELGALGEEFVVDLLDFLEEGLGDDKNSQSANEIIRNIKVDPKTLKKYYPKEEVKYVDPETLAEEKEREIDSMMEELKRKMKSENSK